MFIVTLGGNIPEALFRLVQAIGRKQKPAEQLDLTNIVGLVLDKIVEMPIRLFTMLLYEQSVYQTQPNRVILGILHGKLLKLFRRRCVIRISLKQTTHVGNRVLVGRTIVQGTTVVPDRIVDLPLLCEDVSAVVQRGCIRRIELQYFGKGIYGVIEPIQALIHDAKIIKRVRPAGFLRQAFPVFRPGLFELPETFVHETEVVVKLGMVGVHLQSGAQNPERFPGIAVLMQQGSEVVVRKCKRRVKLNCFLVRGFRVLEVSQALMYVSEVVIDVASIRPYRKRLLDGGEGFRELSELTIRYPEIILGLYIVWLDLNRFFEAPRGAIVASRGAVYRAHKQMNRRSPRQLPSELTCEFTGLFHITNFQRFRRTIEPAFQFFLTFFNLLSGHLLYPAFFTLYHGLGRTST